MDKWTYFEGDPTTTESTDSENYTYYEEQPKQGLLKPTVGAAARAVESNLGRAGDLVKGGSNALNSLLSKIAGQEVNIIPDKAPLPTPGGIAGFLGTAAQRAYQHATGNDPIIPEKYLGGKMVELPSSADLRNVTKVLTGNTLEPETGIDQAAQNIGGLTGSLFGGGGVKELARLAGISAATEGLGELVPGKYKGIVKATAPIVLNTLANNVGAIEKNAFTNTQNSIKEGAKTAATNSREKLPTILKTIDNTTMDDKTKKDLIHVLEKIENNVDKDGNISVASLWDALKYINEKGGDFTGRIYQILKDYKAELTKDLEAAGKQGLIDYKSLKLGNQLKSVASNPTKAKDFFRKYAKVEKLNLTNPFQAVIAGGSFVGLPLASAIDPIMRSPEMAELVAKRVARGLPGYLREQE